MVRLWTYQWFSPIRSKTVLRFLISIFKLSSSIGLPCDPQYFVESTDCGTPLSSILSSAIRIYLMQTKLNASSVEIFNISFPTLRQMFSGKDFRKFWISFELICGLLLGKALPYRYTMTILALILSDDNEAFIIKLIYSQAQSNIGK